eukprot:15461505-Alexandrium_andersonii.AAC.1
MQRACTCSCPALGWGGGVNWPRLALGQRCPRAQRSVCEAARLGAPTNSLRRAGWQHLHFSWAPRCCERRLTAQHTNACAKVVPSLPLASARPI